MQTSWPPLSRRTLCGREHRKNSSRWRQKLGCESQCEKPRLLQRQQSCHRWAVGALWLDMNFERDLKRQANNKVFKASKPCSSGGLGVLLVLRLILMLRNRRFAHRCQVDLIIARDAVSVKVVLSLADPLEFFCKVGLVLAFAFRISHSSNLNITMKR